MFSTQAASSQASQQKIDDLLNEIAFQKVLLSSIDDSVENREEAEAEVRNEIKTLEKHLLVLKRGTASSSSQSAAASSSQVANSREPHSKPRKETMMDDFSPGRSGYQGMFS
jgi:septal ring factor EnvC (AmiA/AmiB activator)